MARCTSLDARSGWKSGEIRGRHEALVTSELFEPVQHVMDALSGVGRRQHHHHHHYLKGSLWCGECRNPGGESRMVLNRGVGRRGGEYLYYFSRPPAARRRPPVPQGRLHGIGSSEPLPRPSTRGSLTSESVFLESFPERRERGSVLVGWIRPGSPRRREWRRSHGLG